LAEPTRKSEQAFRTIGELADDLGVPQHICATGKRVPAAPPAAARRQSPLLPPCRRSAAHRIHRLLNQDGYTIRGVQQLLDGGAAESAEMAPRAAPARKPERGFPHRGTSRASQDAQGRAGLTRHSRERGNPASSSLPFGYARSGTSRFRASDDVPWTQ
jgi:hypothetical protein